MSELSDSFFAALENNVRSGMRTFEAVTKSVQDVAKVFDWKPFPDVQAALEESEQLIDEAWLRSVAISLEQKHSFRVESQEFSKTTAASVSSDAWGKSGSV